MTFALFDYPRTIIRLSVTPGYTDQATGNWIPESTAETEIQAHITDISLKERQYLDPGVVDKGVRKLICESSIAIAVGDRIKITEEDSTITAWFVNSKISESNLMNQYMNASRISYLLIRK